MFRQLPSLSGLLVVVAALSAGTALPAQAGATLVVDDDGRGSAVDCDAADPAFGAIQDAVDTAQPGDTVFICPGVYDEQVVVATSDLTLLGSGTALTIIRPSVAHADGSIIPPIPVAPILLFDGATGAAAREFTIDGGAADSGAANVDCFAGGFYIGLFLQNSSGVIGHLHITGIKSASMCTSGLFARSSGGGVTDVAIANNLFDNYANIGLACSGPATTCTITGNTVRGRGPVDDELQAGINIRNGAAAEITGNVITDHFYLAGNGLPDWSVGIFLVAADPRTHAQLRRDNLFANNQLDVQHAAINKP